MWLLIPWYVYALLSTLLVAAKSVLQKVELKQEHSLDYVVAFSSVAAVLALFLWPWVNWSQMTWPTVAYIYSASLFGSVGIWMGTKAVRHLELSFVTPQTVLSTAFTLLFAYIFLGDKLTATQLLGTVVLVLGGMSLARGLFLPAHNWGWLGMIRTGDLFKQKTELFYELLLLGSMLVFGFASVFDKLALARIDVIGFIFLVSLFLFINHLVIYALVTGDIRQITGRVDHLGWMLVGIALIATLSRLAYSQALSMAELSLVVPIKHSAVLFTTLLGGQLFKEKAVLSRVGIAAIMLVGMWLLVR